MEQQIIVYTQPGCASCGQVKRWLQEQQVPFIEKNIRDDPQAVREVQEHGSLGVPTTIIGDAVVIGFNAKQLAMHLGL